MSQFPQKHKYCDAFKTFQFGCPNQTCNFKAELEPYVSCQTNERCIQKPLIRDIVQVKKTKQKNI